VNLHSLHASATQWLWVSADGANGRYIGNHAYQLDRGEPSPLNETRPGWAHRWWIPDRYNWQPWQNAVLTLFTNGYVRPLCGKTSRSRWPSAHLSNHTGCTECRRVAAGRGIMIKHYIEAQEADPMYRAFAAERDAWRLAHQVA
jgi:hypothetical protein